jgi:hypothetical protein
MPPADAGIRLPVEGLYVGGLPALNIPNHAFTLGFVKDLTIEDGLELPFFPNIPVIEMSGDAKPRITDGPKG